MERRYRFQRMKQKSFNNNVILNKLDPADLKKHLENKVAPKKK